MQVESLYDVTNEDVQVGKFGRRCVNCGNVEDALICHNRLVRPSLRNAPRGGTVEAGVITLW